MANNEALRELARRELRRRALAKMEIGKREGIEAQKPRSVLDVAAGGSPEQLEQMGHPYAAAIQRTGKDLVTIPANFFNMLLLNAPRSITEKAGYKYPERAEGKVADITARGAGVAGAVTSPAVTALDPARGSVLMRSLKGALIGGAYSPEDFTDVKARTGQALVGAAIPPAMRAGRFVRQLTPNIIRKAAGVTSKQAKWIKQRGDKVFEPLKERVDYIKSVLAPKTYKLYEDKVSKVLNKSTKMYDSAIEKLKQPTIKLDKTYRNIRAILKNYDLIDERGMLTGNIKEKEVPSAIKTIATMYDDMVGGSVTQQGNVPVTMSPIKNKGFFKFYRQTLRTMQKGAGAFKKDVQQVIDGLYDDVENAGATGIKEARRLYRQAMQFEDKYPLSYEKFASKLQGATNPKNWEFTREQMRPIFGKQTDEIFNSIKDHTIVADVLAKSGNVPIGRTGVIARIGKSALREYYEKAYPLYAPARKAVTENVPRIIDILKQGQLK